jgi:cytochrome c553
LKGDDPKHDPGAVAPATLPGVHAVGMKTKFSLRTTALLAPLILAPAIAFAASSADLWTDNCARCHGPDGAGNTKIGKKLGLKDYSNAAVQDKMTDEEIENAIRNGVKDQKGKERMPAYKSKLSDQEVKDLAAKVRSFKK